MISPRAARAQLSTKRQPLSIAEQAARAERIGRDAYRLPSSSTAYIWRTVNVARRVCSCPGFAVALKHDHLCRHWSAVLLHIAGDLLLIHGAPPAWVLAGLAGQVEQGIDALAYRYTCNPFDAPHYGRGPNHSAGVIWEIGLQPAARGRELTEIEREAIAFSLRAMAAETEAEHAAA